MGLALHLAVVVCTSGRKRKRKCTNGGRLTQTHILLLNMRLTESSIFSALVCRSGSGRHSSTTKSKYLRTKLDETYAHRTKRSVNMLECANALKTCKKRSLLRQRGESRITLPRGSSQTRETFSLRRLQVSLAFLLATDIQAVNPVQSAGRREQNFADVVHGENKILSDAAYA